jgi:hypothetical protein
MMWQSQQWLWGSRRNSERKEKAFLWNLLGIRENGYLIGETGESTKT